MRFERVIAGIKEEDLLSEMVALTPLSAKRLLDELLEQELVLVNVTRFTPAGPPGSPPRAEQVRMLLHCLSSAQHSKMATVQIVIKFRPILCIMVDVMVDAEG